MKKLLSQSMKSTRCTDSLAVKRRSGCSATLFSYCAGIKIKPPASLRIIPSDRKQRWRELELPRRTSIREKFSQSNRSASNALTSRSSKKIAGNETKRKIEY